MARTRTDIKRYDLFELATFGCVCGQDVIAFLDGTRSDMFYVIRHHKPGDGCGCFNILKCDRICSVFGLIPSDGIRKWNSKILATK